MRNHASESKIEKEKKQYKDQMWNKVNMWLGDIDEKGGKEKGKQLS